ncbi:MAG: hypothetical protein KBF71_04295 [Alphaproteobacteria bacterium]|nr:hypothetical protein [Alphaproteobacteria bacterium]
MRIQLYNLEQLNNFEIRFDAVDKGLNSRYLTPEFAWLADTTLTGILTAVGGDALLREIYNKDLSPEGWSELIHPLDILSILSLTMAYQLKADQVRELCNEIVHFDMASKNCEAILVRSAVMKQVIEASKAIPARPISGNTHAVEIQIQNGLRSVLSNNDRLVKARKMTQQQARLIMSAYNNPQHWLDPETVGGAKNSLIEKSPAFGGLSYVELYQQYLDIKNPKPLPVEEPRVDLRPAEALDSYNHLLILYLKASPQNLNEIRSALGNRAVQILGSDTRPALNSFLSPEALARGKAVSERRRGLDSGFLLAQWLGNYEVSRVLLGNITEAQYFLRMKEELDNEIKAALRPVSPNPNPAPVPYPVPNPAMFIDDFLEQFVDNDLPAVDNYDDPDFDWTSYIAAQEAVSVEEPEMSREPKPLITQRPINPNLLTVDTYKAFVDEICHDPKYLANLAQGDHLQLKLFEDTIASLRSIYANSIDVPQVVKALSISQLQDLFEIASDPYLSVGFVMEAYNETEFENVRFQTQKKMPNPQRFQRKTEALFQRWSGQKFLPDTIRTQLKKSEDFQELSDPEIVELFQNTFKWLDPDTMLCLPGILQNENHKDYPVLYYLIPIAAVQSAFEEDV